MRDVEVEVGLPLPDSAENAPDGQRLGTAIVAILAAIVAGFSDGEPTGLTVWDWVLKALVAALFVVAVSVSPRWVVIVVATIGAAFLSGSVWLVPAGLGLLLAIGANLVPRYSHWLTLGAAGLAIQGLLRIPPTEFFGLPSLIAGGAITLAFVFGYNAAHRETRRKIRWAVLAASLITALAAAAGGLTLLSAKSDVERGIEAARDGLSAARGGDPEAVVEQLESAAQSLSAAEDRSNSLLAQPLRLIPIAAQHRNAITTATGTGSAIARQASKATIDADISSITMSAGSVDLSALQAMEPDLNDTAALLETGVRDLRRARSPWLVPQVSSRMDDLTDEMASVLPEARLAADAARVVPGLLGQAGPRRYFVAFGSPAESRELGGFVGSWALLEFDAGDVTQVDAGRVSDLYDISRSNAPLGPLGYPDWYMYRALPEFWPQNITSSPDLHTVAAASRELFDGLGGAPIDGFVYLDGFALGDLLEITGPIDIEGLDQTLSSRSAADFFFDGQYRVDARDEVKTELSDIFAGVFAGVLDTQLPGPERLGNVLGPAARQGRLQVATFDSDENAFLRSVKLQRSFGLPQSSADGFALVQANGSASKLDLYLHRDVDYSVTVDADGQLHAAVSVELRSDIPDDAPEYALGRDAGGRNVLYLSLYSPHELASVGVDGEIVEAAAIEEFGYWRYEVTVELPPNAVRRIDFELDGQIDVARAYELSVWHQPLVNNDTVRASYVGPDGEHSEGFELIEDTIVDFAD